MKRFTVAAFALLTSLPVLASQWVIVDLDVKNFMSQTLVNINSIKDFKNPTRVGYWTAIVNVDPTQAHDVAILHIVGDCPTTKMMVTDAKTYRKGKLLENITKDNVVRWTKEESPLVASWTKKVCSRDWDGAEPQEFNGPKDIASKSQQQLRDLKKITSDFGKEMEQIIKGKPF